MSSEDIFDNMCPAPQLVLQEAEHYTEPSREDCTYDPRQCGVCNEDFDEDSRCPRTLRCSHHLCSSCIECLIVTRSKKCPFCRRHFKANKAGDVMINQGILDFITYLSRRDIVSEEAKSSNIVSSNSRIDDYKEEVIRDTNNLLIICQDEKNQLEAIVMDVQTLKEQLKLDNIQINEVILPKIRSVAKRNFQKIEELQLKEKKLKDQLLEVQLKEKHTQDRKVKLGNTTCFREMVKLMDESEISNAAVGDWAKKSKTRICGNQNDFQSVEKELQPSSELVQLLSDTLNSSVFDDDEDTNPFPTCVI